MKLVSGAKINLGLDILDRRADGYHTIRTVMQSLDFGDVVEVRYDAREDGQDAEIVLSCTDPALPCDETNLAWRAARSLADAYGLGGRITITIDKCIPLAAGLAGGSGDAAAVLIAVDRICHLHLSPETLDTFALTLGADVPYCLRQGTALAEGVGEVLRPLSPQADVGVLLVKPPIGVSTKWAYESWDSQAAPYHPDIDGLTDLLERDGLLAAVQAMGNTFEPIVFDRYPNVARIKEEMLRLGAAGALMSGSGPTVFGLFDNDATLAAAADAFRDMDMAEAGALFVRAAHTSGGRTHTVEQP